MTEFETGARRDTGGKGRCDLLPHSSLLRVSRHMEGALDTRWMAWHECPDCGYEGRCTRCLCATA